MPARHPLKKHEAVEVEILNRLVCVYLSEIVGLHVSAYRAVKD
ncbi:MAG: hypothetical protein Q8J76_05850 [Desulfobulbaceae bacterium]|nr:hypothetical protein [Desulfobulbaceae bacterium]